MNFIEVFISNDKGLFIDFCGKRVSLDYIKTDISRYVDKKVILGVRPEDFILSDTDKGIRASIITAELIGSEVILSVKISDLYDAYIKINADNYKEGMEDIFIEVNTNKVHLFDVESEENIIL
ncbi:MAG: hypothetical protein FWD58_02700 [Firmicutes bacterium]|nr:hypothetical protein [Bacillota bacterium]